MPYGDENRSKHP
jgi:hypothetical protein